MRCRTRSKYEPTFFLPQTVPQLFIKSDCSFYLFVAKLLVENGEKAREAMEQLRAAEDEIADLRRQLEAGNAGVRNITKMEQTVQEKNESLIDELDLELEEVLANDPEDGAIPISKKEVVLTYEELKEVKYDLELQLDEEKANTVAKEIKLKKEIDKIKSELEHEKKEVIRLEVQLDNSAAEKESEAEKVRNELKEKVENLRAELRTVKEAEKVAIQRIKDMVPSFSHTKASLKINS